MFLVIQEQKEEIANHELTRRLAQQWNNLTQDEKKVCSYIYISYLVIQVV